jgi:hypothetical protein
MTGVAQTQVWRILHHNGFYPCHIQRVQLLLLGDHANYVWFCELLQLWIHILCDILFMNETQFTPEGITNTRILHSWVHENPHEVAECHNQHHCSVNLWCGVLESDWTTCCWETFNISILQDFFNKMNLLLPLTTWRMWLQTDEHFHVLAER